MYVTVNGARLYFDVEGAGLVPDGPRMREKPTLLLLHGGPGFDHTMYKPAFSQLADIAQVIYLDQRGQGRSGGDDPATWTLAQWGDDVKGLCDALGIEKPIVFGGSFGGFVAQSYATRHPEHPGKLILASTAAKIIYEEVFRAFERVGGKAARDVAEPYWLEPTMERRLKYLEKCFPLYNTRAKSDPDALKRAILDHNVGLAFNGPNNEQGRMDFRADLARVRCPVLVLAGDTDPIMPIVLSETMAQCLPQHLLRFERFENCGHGVHRDDPERAFRVLREFIST
jgi:pimeloyl-ACP methyl ester carboxylesterase